jgi:hypothetical protein
VNLPDASRQAAAWLWPAAKVSAAVAASMSRERRMERLSVGSGCPTPDANLRRARLFHSCNR